MFLLRVRRPSHTLFKKKILPVLDATVIVLCHTLTFGLKRGFFLVFCPCPSLKHWALFACLLRLCKQAKHWHPVHVWICISRECFFPRSHAHPPPSFFLHPRPKAHQKLQTFVAVRRLQGLCFFCCC